MSILSGQGNEEALPFPKSFSRSSFRARCGLRKSRCRQCRHEGKARRGAGEATAIILCRGEEQVRREQGREEEQVRREQGREEEQVRREQGRLVGSPFK